MVRIPQGAGYPNGGYGTQNSSAAQNDAIAWKRALSAGTYTIQLAVVESTNRGIATVKIDGASVGTLDRYNGTPGTLALLALSGITVASSGVHEIRLVMATKNASSSAYNIGLLGVGVSRTS